MKAVILAAGKGERLGEVTRQLPKPMIQFQGKPILEHNIDLCRKYGATAIYINTHHLPDLIRGHFGDGTRWGVNIEYSFEPELLGTAGAVKSFERNLSEEPFFVLYGDNYSNYDLDALKKVQTGNNALAVIAFHWRKETSSSGVAEFGGKRRILRFIEKPKPGESTSHWVNAGIYYFSPEIFTYLPQGYSDFAKEIFPLLLRKHVPLFGVCRSTDVRAFDTPEMLQNSMKGSA
jgi:mannose-1-phosphate guanylyltransferase